MSDFETKYRGWHTKLSFIKSGVRIGSCIAGTILGSWIPLAIGFAIAELIGIAEEWV